MFEFPMRYTMKLNLLINRQTRRRHDRRRYDLLLELLNRRRLPPRRQRKAPHVAVDLAHSLSTISPSPTQLTLTPDLTLQIVANIKLNACDYLQGD